jgi:hypothetical protein
LIPAEIQNLIDYDDDDSNLVITKTDYSGDIPNLNLALYDLDKLPKYWVLEVIGHIASHISYETIISDSTILFTDDHPLLWEYSDMQSELYFGGSSNEIYKIISELNQIDFRLFGRYRNSSQQLYTLLRSSHGSLGKGSKKLLEMYADCLSKYNIKTSIVYGYTPTYSDAKSQFSGSDLKLLFIRGSYIIGKDFNFTTIA